MNARQASALGGQIARLIQQGQLDRAHELLAPVLARRTPFRLLDRIGVAVGAGPLPETNLFLDRIAVGRTEGGWVIIGSALGQQLDRNLEGAFARCRTCVASGGVWYAADILGDRVPGPALLAHFGPALSLLAPWRSDEDRWVRRTVGIAVHFWAKRSRGAPELGSQAGILLTFLEPMFEEWDLDAVKGVGWGLKTLGRHYPHLLAGWLSEQLVERKRHPRALMLRKATAYLPAEHGARLAGEPLP